MARFFIDICIPGKTFVDSDGLDTATRDFLAGMTDRYAVSLFEDLFVPRSWNV